MLIRLVWQQKSLFVSVGWHCVVWRSEKRPLGLVVWLVLARVGVSAGCLLAKFHCACAEAEGHARLLPFFVAWAGCVGMSRNVNKKLLRPWMTVD